MYKDNLELLKQRCGLKIFRHSVNINSPILPFRVDSRDQTKFDRGFDGIMGEFARISSDKCWDKNFDLNKIVNNIVLNDELEYDEDNNEFLKSIISEYLAKDKTNVKVLHPYLFLYLSKTVHLRADNEKEIATFFRDVMFRDLENFNEFFNNKNSDNILMKLILKNLPELPTENIPFKYYPCLNFVTEVFKEDIEYIKNKSTFLINNMDNIFAFYYFYYCSQMILKLNQSFNVDLSKPSKIYYLLDWEKSSKSRKSINEGYNILKESNKKLFINMVLIEHFNTLLGTNALLVNQLEDFVNSNPNKEDYFSCLKEWVNYYETIHNLDIGMYFENFRNYVKIYHDDLEKSIRNQQNVGFSFNLENIGKKYFLKRRGQYGYTLNITKDFLYLITALCVKKDKIKLNDLFKEYGMRGLFFDRYSKEEIINLLNSWNLIDKKSDSGDAQYVKQIL